MKRICWGIVAGLLAACTPVPPFTGVNGEPVSLAQFAGKPLLINYFAPWCAPCLREMPLLAQLAREGSITVVVINYDPATPAQLTALVKRYRIPLPLLIPRPEASLPFPRPTGLPTSYLLDGAGQLRETVVGELDQQKIAGLKARVAAHR